MALEDDIRFLRRIATFRVLGPDALRVLAISAEKLHLRANDALFAEGEPADSAYAIAAGTIRLQRAGDQDLSEATVVGAGALIGESALIVDTERPSSALALQPCTLFKVSRGTFLRMLESDEGAARALRETIAQRIASTLQELDTVLPLFETEL